MFNIYRLIRESSKYITMCIHRINIR